MTRVKISTTDEFLAVLPHQLGYRLDSCVVISMVTDKTIGPVVRADLPPEKEVASESHKLLEQLRQIHPGGALLVGYESVPGESRSMLRRLHRGLQKSGVGIIDHVVVRDGRWWGWCCRPPNQLDGLLPGHLDGHPMPDEAAVPAVAEFISFGSSPLASRDEVTALVTEDPEVSLGVGDALDEIWEGILDEIDPDGVLHEPALDPGGSLGIDGGEGDWGEGHDEGHARLVEEARSRAMAWIDSIDRVPQLWARVLAPLGDRGDTFQASDGEVAEMVHSLADKAWRDALVAWASPVMFPPDQMDEDVTALLRRHVPAGPVADAEHSATVLRRLQSMARRVPDEWSVHAAAISTVTACVAWGVGNGACAGDGVTRALAVVPDYTLAVYLGRLITHQVRPRTQWSDFAA